MEIRELTTRKGRKYINRWRKNPESVKRGLFIYPSTQGGETAYVAIDNEFGHCDVNEMDTKEDCINWLNGIFPENQPIYGDDPGDAEAYGGWHDYHLSQYEEWLSNGGCFL